MNFEFVLNLDGKVLGRGLLTFTDNTHGLPRNEGYFEGNKLIHREKCSDVVNKAIQAAKNANKLINSKIMNQNLIKTKI